MSSTDTYPEDSRAEEITELRERLREAEETLRTIREGEIATRAPGDQAYPRKEAEWPYRHLIEQMRDGALLLTSTGLILYCNRRFAELVQRPLETVVGRNIQEFISSSDRVHFEALARDCINGSLSSELHLK